MASKFIPNRSVTRKVEAELTRRLNASAQIVRNAVIESLNRTQPLDTRVSSAGRVSIIGRDPSKPGQPPKRVSDTLYKSIVAGVRTKGGELQGVIGSTDEKAAWLEFGTLRLAARPFLRPALKKSAARVKRIMNRGK